VLTLSGVVEPRPSTGAEDLFVEVEPGSYYRQFTVSDVIDQSRIEAKLTDGVLRLHLPKVEAVKPRQITVKVG
jgi:HSP20 family molecular chaperone IbpA